MSAASTRVESSRDAAAIGEALVTARARSLALLDPVPTAGQERQVSDLMSPLCWDLAHIGHYEELWLVRALTGTAPTDRSFDDVYDAFKHPRRERSTLDILDPAGARAYVASVRAHALDVLARTPAADLRSDAPDPLRASGFVYGMVAQHEHQHDETMLATLQLMDDFAHPAADGDGLAAPDVTAPRRPDVLVDGGPFTMGTATTGPGAEPWAYDN